MPRVVVAALLRPPGEVLLCYRSAHREWYPNIWDFPGGHIEDDEAPLDALAREIFEEVGVSVHIESLTETPHLRLNDGNLDLSAWAVRSWEGEPVNCAPEEHDRVEWFEIQSAVAQKLAHPTYLPWLAALGGES